MGRDLASSKVMKSILILGGVLISLCVNLLAEESVSNRLAAVPFISETTQTVTNTTETPIDFEYYLPGTCPEADSYAKRGTSCLVNHLGPGVNPRGKIVRTTIKEVHTLVFQWRGKERTQTDEVIKGETSKHFTLEMKTNWVEQANVKSTENITGARTLFVLTNAPDGLRQLGIQR
jgi:hypothetical protein